MSLFGIHPLPLVLIAVYVLGFIVLNTISFLIALFYKKKFKQSSPRWGFVIAVGFAFLFIVCLLGGQAGSPVMQGLARGAVTVSFVASVFSTASLIVIMQRVRK